MKSTTFKTFIALALCHWLIDCYTGIWPIFKYLAKLDLAKAGLIASVTTMICAGLQPVFGVLSDGGRQRFQIILGAALTSLIMLVGPATFLRDALGPTAWYWLLFLIVLGSRFGSSMFHPSATSAAGNLKDSHRSTLVSLFIACGMFGFAVSHGLFSVVYHHFDAHTEVMLIPGVVIVFIGWWWCGPDRKHLSTGHGLGQRWAVLRSIRGPLTILFLVEVAMGAMYHGFIFLMPEFLEMHGCPGQIIRGGGYFCWVTGTVLFMIPLGRLADRVGSKGILVTCAAVSLAFFYLTVIPQGLGWGVYLILLFITGGFSGAVNPLGVALGQRLAPNHASVVSGILMGLAWAVSSPALWLAGWMADHPSIEITNAVLILSGFGVVAVILSFFVKK